MEGHVVQVISREIVKPSSPTPNRLKKLKLSYLDQLQTHKHLPLIFFYEAADESKGLLTTSNHVQISQQLKQSLSRTLTSFYPFAGRYEEDYLVVDCNDAGVEFIEARVDARLNMDAMKDPNNIMQNLLTQYHPVPDQYPTSTREWPLVAVQITFFNCGGISLGCCISHKIADFSSMVRFLNAWAAASRGEADNQISQSISFNLADYFPPKDNISSSRSAGKSNEKLMTMTKRFVFDKEKLAILRQPAVSSSSGSMVKDPTRVELVSAFIWKHFITREISAAKHISSSSSSNHKKERLFIALIPVNLRARTHHLPLENTFGNCFMSALAFSTSNSNDHDDLSPPDVQFHHDLVSELRRSVRTINDDYITKAQRGDNYVNDLNKLFSLLADGEGECCNFSSWIWFPVYELDYGWGSPIWFCPTALKLKNTIVLISSKCGENVEAWVDMEQDNLEMLENQINLISAT